jgi:microcystin-dependent protein
MEPFIGTAITFGFNFPPRGWALCDGQLLSIAQNSALFSLLGTTFGGDGRTSFGLPDLRGRSQVHVGTGPGLSHIGWGQRSGYEFKRLSIPEMPYHNHTATFDGSKASATPATATTEVTVNAHSGLGDQENADSSYWATAKSGFNPIPDSFSTSKNTTMASDAVKVDVTITAGSLTGGEVTVNNTGGSQEFSIRNPNLGMYSSIALQGIFPSRN